MKEKVASGVLSIGVPAALGNLLMSLSGILMNSKMAKYGDMAIAGVGVAMKVTMMTGMVCIGLGQGCPDSHCTSFLFGVFYVLINALQARGAATESLIVNISRQGLIYIPACSFSTRSFTKQD